MPTEALLALLGLVCLGIAAILCVVLFHRIALHLFFPDQHEKQKRERELDAEFRERWKDEEKQ